MSILIAGRKPGIYNSIDFDTYRSIPAVNASALKHAVRSLAHYRHAMKAQREQTEAHIVGEALHLAILESEKFAARVVKRDKVDGRTKAGKEYAAAFAEQHAGKLILDADDYAAVEDMRESCASCPAIRQLMKQTGQAEATALWREANGLDAKARFDRISFGSKRIVDVKSAREASPEGFARAIAQYGYHFSAAYYLRGAEHLAGPGWGFSWVVIEKEPPFACAVYEPTERMLDVAHNQIEVALRRVKEAEESGEYPAYSAEAQAIDIPEWAVHGWGE